MHDAAEPAIVSNASKPAHAAGPGADKAMNLDGAKGKKNIRLTSRESDVLRLIARGCTYAQAANALGVSRHTVAAHIKNAYRKLGVHSGAAAVMRALELRIIGKA
jgi:DNA-binding NarL/FixJ family response regulator